MVGRRFWWVWLWLACAAAYAGDVEAPPFEVVKDHVNIEVMAEGTFVETREVNYRILTNEGIAKLHELSVSYTDGFENFFIANAYTLKPDGRRLLVSRNGILSGIGQSSLHGFQDARTVSIFFPNVEVGDCLVLVTVHRQLKPWFAGEFDFASEFSPAVAMHDIVYTVTAPASLKLKIDEVGMTLASEKTESGKVCRVWEFHNDKPSMSEEDAVDERDYAPHLFLSTFTDYAAAAAAYRERSKGKSEVTPAISKLADDLTAGVSNPREQARILYDWVSSHVAYAAIVLGAGGFTPHPASEVLSNLYGDCKDHVVLLEALFAAKNIASSPVLIDAGSASFKLPTAASPHAFDHVITYLPDFDVYADSTAQVAPFGVLPYSDVGKPALRVDTGNLSRTPIPLPATSSIRLVTKVDIDADGDVAGRTSVTSSGAIGIEMRALAHAISAGKETEYIRMLMGPGAEGKIDRGSPDDLKDPYLFSFSYTVPNAIALPGPGALPAETAIRPFSFSKMVAGPLPVSRSGDYICSSQSAEEVATISLPAGVGFLSIPKSKTLTADGIRLHLGFERKNSRTVVRTVSLTVDHPGASCSAPYYAGVRLSLKKMTKALREQIVFTAAKAGKK